MANQGLFGHNRPPQPAPQHPQVTDAWLRHFKQLVQTGQATAVESATKLMYATSEPFVPSSPELHEYLARTLNGQQRFASALAEVEYALRLLPNFPPYIHLKCLIMLNQARTIITGNEASTTRVTEIRNAQLVLDAFFRDVPAGRKNVELASLDARISRELWTEQHLRGDVQRARDAYEQAWKADRGEYYPLINYLELYLTLELHDRKPIHEVDAALAPFYTELFQCCDAHRLKGETTFWIDFTAAQAHLMQDDFRRAKDAYKAGLKCIPPPTPQDWASAMQSVDRLHAIAPQRVTAEMVQEIKGLIGVLDVDILDNTSH